MSRQQTIAAPRTLRGVGLHTGRECAVVLRAAEPGAGVIFRRTDRPGADLPARLEHVTETRSCVVLGGEDGVRTVEHLLSAARALGVDNLLVEVDGPEIPGMDGSALPFVGALRDAGLRAQDVPRRVLRAGAPAWAGDAGADCWAVALPADRLSITCVVSLREPAAQEQAATWDAAAGGYEETIAPARTWGYERDAAALRARGLALGASLENTLAIGGSGFLNPPRFPNEPARHKVLDLLGDLALLGVELQAAVIAVRAGHTQHIALARALAAQLGEG